MLRIHKNVTFDYNKLELPSWLDELKKLEILDLEGEYVSFPNVALKIGKTASLPYTFLQSQEAMNIENWKYIETLKHIRAKDWMKCSSRLMAAGCHLRELSIFISPYDDNNMASMRASLETMANLVEVHLEASVAFSISMHKKFPHLDSLTTIKVKGGMLDCVAESVFPPNLSHLTLSKVGKKEDAMLVLGKLLKLQYLTLWDVTCSERMRVLYNGSPASKPSPSTNVLSESYKHRTRWNSAPQTSQYPSLPTSPDSESAQTHHHTR